jgi:valyl-tRNA synthetase
MSEKRVEGYRHFINKLWNAARFSLMHIKPEHAAAALGPDAIRALPDKWILSRLQHVSQTVAQALDDYRFNEAAGTLYQFVWHEFCDWYLEAIKPILYDEQRIEERETTLAVLRHVLQNTLILLHPFIPFVTEEIWHRLPGADGSIMKAAFPADSDAGFQAPDAEKAMDLVISVVTGIRNIRGEMNLSPSLALDAVVHSEEDTNCRTIHAHEDLITTLARLTSLSVDHKARRPKAAATAVVDGATIYVPLEGIIDFSKEIQRLEKEIGKLTQELVAVNKKLDNDAFLSKAPADVVAKVKDKQTLLSEKREKLQGNLDRIRSLGEK